MVSEAQTSVAHLWTLDAGGELRRLSRGWLEAALSAWVPAGQCRSIARVALGDLGRAYPAGGFVDPGELQDRLWLDLAAGGAVSRARALARPPRHEHALAVRGSDGSAYHVDRGRLLGLLAERCRALEGVDGDRLCHEAASGLVSGLTEAQLARVLAPYGRAWLGALDPFIHH
jgi:hypothetical protein